jgi:hypothetical protein
LAEISVDGANNVTSIIIGNVNGPNLSTISRLADLGNSNCIDGNKLYSSDVTLVYYGGILFNTGGYYRNLYTTGGGSFYYHLST